MRGRAHRRLGRAALLAATIASGVFLGCSRPAPPAPRVFREAPAAPSGGAAKPQGADRPGRAELRGSADGNGPADKAARAAPASERAAVIQVEGIVCQGCANAAAQAARAVPGVTYARSLFEEGTVVVHYRPEVVAPEAIAQAIAQTERGAAPPFRAQVVAKGEGSAGPEFPAVGR